MKKILSIIVLLIVFGSFAAILKAYAQGSFYEAIKTCEPYSEIGSAKNAQGAIFGIQVTLEKTKNSCVYKEKVYQGQFYQLLTCKFDDAVLPVLSTSMAKYSQTYKKQIDENHIFGATMTHNQEVFDDFLINENYCKITGSRYSQKNNKK